jgi:hypothetical protein
MNGAAWNGYYYNAYPNTPLRFTYNISDDGQNCIQSGNDSSIVYWTFEIEGVGSPSPTPWRCDAVLPEDSRAAILARLIVGEATVGTADHPITNENSADEWAAIAYSAINRSRYLYSHLKVKPREFGADGRTIQDIVLARNPLQYAAIDGAPFNDAAHPETLTRPACARLKSAIVFVPLVLAGIIPDPYVGQVGKYRGEDVNGTFAMRTAGHGSPGNNFFKFQQQIPGSGNEFWGLGKAAKP